MKINISTTQLEKQAKTCVIVGVYKDKSLTPAAAALDKAVNGQIAQLLKHDHFQGKTGQTLPLFHFEGSDFGRILLVGCGEKKTKPADFRKIISATMKALLATNVTHATSYLTELTVSGKKLDWQLKQTGEIVTDSLYRFDVFKSEKEPALTFAELTVHVDKDADQKAATAALNQGVCTANGMALTKTLANSPSNICTPSFLAEQAKDLAKAHSNLTVNVLDEKEMHELGMGSLLAVSQGSAEEAKLICLEYKGGNKDAQPVALVGKGITFDTGGNSLKPPEAMFGMKYDMCGAATVLGTLKAAAELKLPINVVGIIAAVENMPGGTAYKPEDILTSMSGQTIEVVTTDAEGRLVLADALTYCERYKPAYVIDIATLTGAVIIGLGTQATAVMTNHEPLAKDIINAGDETYDRAWQLPLWDEYQEQIKSPFADMANAGGRAAGTITAGCFLSRFAKKYNWAHLDVAGTAAVMSGTNDRRATGRPVPMLVQYLVDQANK